MSLTWDREGLCGNKDNHEPHWHQSTSLGLFWCHADQTRRLPYAAERRRKANDKDVGGDT